MSVLEDGFSIDRDRAWQKEICSSGSQLDMLVAAFEVSFPNGDRIIDKRRGSLLRGPTWAIFHDTRQEVARRFNRVVDLLFQNSGYIRNIRKDFDHMGRLERSSHDPTITIPFMNGFRSHISKPRGTVTSRQFKATDLVRGFEGNCVSHHMHEPQYDLFMYGCAWEKQGVIEMVCIVPLYIEENMEVQSATRSLLKATLEDFSISV